MRRVVAYLKVQVKSYLAAKSSIFVSLLFPVMMTFIFGAIMPKGYLKEVVPGLVGFSILSYSLFSMTAISSKFRFTNIFAQLSLTPLKKSEWLFSVFLWNVAIGALSFLVVITITHFAFSVSISLNILIVGYLLAASLLFVSLGLLIGTVASSIETASLVGNAVGLPMMMLTGTFFPITMLPDYLQKGVQFLPLYYFVKGMGDLMVASKPEDAIVNLVILAGLAAIFFVVATILFKWRKT